MKHAPLDGCPLDDAALPRGKPVYARGEQSLDGRRDLERTALGMLGAHGH